MKRWILRQTPTMASMRLIMLAVLALRFSPSGYLDLHAAELTSRSWQVGSDTREALVHIPDDARSTPAPVVFAFHGHGGTMRNASRTFRIHELWPEAICVYMQGLNTPGQLTDPEGKRPGWQKALGDQQDRDLKFFDVVLESLRQDAKVDETQIFATGHSNGGGFTYLLAATRGDKLAAIAPSAAIAAKGRVNFKAKPTFHLMGSNDPLVKTSWQETMVERLKQLNQCDTEPQPWAMGAGKLFRSKSHTPVVVFIHEQGHKFPDNGAQLIVKFFKEHKAL